MSLLTVQPGTAVLAKTVTKTNCLQHLLPTSNFAESTEFKSSLWSKDNVHIVIYSKTDVLPGSAADDFI